MPTASHNTKWLVFWRISFCLIILASFPKEYQPIISGMVLSHKNILFHLVQQFLQGRNDQKKTIAYLKTRKEHVIHIAGSYIFLFYKFWILSPSKNWTWNRILPCNEQWPSFRFLKFYVKAKVNNRVNIEKFFHICVALILSRLHPWSLLLK